MIAKIANSGWPQECNTDRLRCPYLKQLLHKDGFKVDFDSVQNHPTMGFLAKLTFNTLLGRLPRQPNQPNLNICWTKAFNLCRHDCLIALEGLQWPGLPTKSCLGDSESKIGDKIISIVCGGARMSVYLRNRSRKTSFQNQRNNFEQTECRHSTAK